MALNVLFHLGALGGSQYIPSSSLPIFQDYSIDEEAAFQAALALSLSEN